MWDGCDLDKKYSSYAVFYSAVFLPIFLFVGFFPTVKQNLFSKKWSFFPRLTKI